MFSTIMGRSTPKASKKPGSVSQAVNFDGAAAQGNDNNIAEGASQSSLAVFTN